MPLNAQQMHKQDEKIAHIPSAVMAAWAVTIFVGVNYISNSEDTLPMKLTKTLCSVLINYCLVHVLSLGTVTEAIDTVRIPEKRKAITVGDVTEAVVNTTGSAFASAIYADLNTTLQSSALATPVAWWSYIVVNTPFHYQGMKNLVNQIKRGGFNAIADLGIIMPRGISEYFTRKKLDLDIRQNMSRALHDAWLAHEIAFSPHGHHQLPHFNDADTPYGKANTLVSTIDTSRHLTKTKALTVSKGISNSVLFTSILVALIPFFVDSFDNSAFGMAKFIGTLAANFGLVVLMTKDYTEVIAEAAVYGRVPPLIRRNQHNDFGKRVAIAGTIAAVNTAATVFTVFTTLALFDETISNCFLNQFSKMAAIAMIWFGTIAFNTYAINSLAFQIANKVLLKDDPLLDFCKHSQAIQEQLESKPFANPQALADSMPNAFTAEQNQYLQQGRQLRSGGISSEIDIHQNMREQAKKHVLTGLVKGIIPLAGAATMIYFMQAQLAPKRFVQFGYAALQYAPFLLMHALVNNIAQCKQRSRQRQHAAIDLEAGNQRLLDPAADAGEAARSSCCQRFQSTVTTLLNICKPTMVGFAIDALIRLIEYNVELPMSNQAVSLTASGLGLSAALASSLG